MKKALLRNLSPVTRNILSPPISKPSPNHGNTSLLSLSSPSLLKLRFFASKNDTNIENPNPSLPETNLVQPQDKDFPIDVDDVSNQELKRQIEKYFEGDEEAIPSIFEAILKRRLAGKHDESDDELMKELGHKPLDHVSDSEFGSDSDNMLGE